MTRKALRERRALAWLDDGVLLLEPAGRGRRAQRAGSAGIHGDETAPIELLSLLVRDIAHGGAALACRLLVILGNVDAMRAGSVIATTI